MCDGLQSIEESICEGEPAQVSVCDGLQPGTCEGSAVVEGEGRSGASESDPLAMPSVAPPDSASTRARQGLGAPEPAMRHCSIYGPAVCLPALQFPGVALDLRPRGTFDDSPAGLCAKMTAAASPHSHPTIAPVHTYVPSLQETRPQAIAKAARLEEQHGSFLEPTPPPKHLPKYVPSGSYPTGRMSRKLHVPHRNNDVQVRLCQDARVSTMRNEIPLAASPRRPGFPRERVALVDYRKNSQPIETHARLSQMIQQEKRNLERFQYGK